MPPDNDGFDPSILMVQANVHRLSSLETVGETIQALLNEIADGASSKEAR